MILAGVHLNLKSERRLTWRSGTNLVKRVMSKTDEA